MYYSDARYRAALRRARRRYRHGRTPMWQKAVLGAAGIAALAGAVTHVHAHATHGLPDSVPPPPPLSGALPPGIGTSRLVWAKTLLRRIPEPLTTCNKNAVVAWETREGGGFGNQAQNNPVNVNPGPGSGWPGYPATGAWAFPTPAIGLAYTVQTLENGDYGNVLAALHAGDSAQAVCDALMASPWAASRYNGTLTASC